MPGDAPPLIIGHYREQHIGQKLLVVLGEAGEQAVYFTALVAGFGFCCTGKSASVGGACLGGLLSTIEL